MNMFLNLTEDKESSFDPIPAGTYNLIVTNAEETETKNKDKRIKLTFSVSEGEYAGRKIFEGYQLSGNEKAVQIGRGQLKSLWKCAGHTEFIIKSAQDFNNIEIAASVKIQPGKDGYDAKNSISSFKPKIKSVAADATPF